MNTTELIKILENLFDSYGYAISFFSSFIEISPIGWMIPGGLLLSVAGFFSYNSNLSLLAVLIFAWLGAWLTFVLAYFFGSLTGNQFIKIFKQEKNARSAELLLKKHGGVILTTSMLASITRFWVAYVAGMNNYNKIKFLIYSSTASLTWSSLMVILGYFAGSERQQLEKNFGKTGIIGWVFLSLAAAVIYWTIKKELKTSSKE